MHGSRLRIGLLWVSLVCCVSCIPRFDTSRDCQTVQDCFKGERCDVIKGCVDIEQMVPSTDQDAELVNDAMSDGLATPAIEPSNDVEPSELDAHLTPSDMAVNASSTDATTDIDSNALDASDVGLIPPGDGAVADDANLGGDAALDP